MDYNSYRRKSREVCIGKIKIGGSSPIAIQSMTNTDTKDKEATLNQVLRLCESGCEIVRLTAPDLEACRTFEYLKAKGIEIPLVADIHFDYKIAIAAADMGADKIRINPGNIGSKEKVAKVVEACRKNKVPIRIGVNSGSLESHILEKYQGVCAEALAESALYHAEMLRELDFHEVVISVKASDVNMMVKANRILAERTSYPLHLGVTEAGFGNAGLIKSSVGIGALLSLGIGDTVRVSLTDKPEEEIFAARSILNALDLLPDGGMNIVSCPTCGRTKIDLIPLVREFERRAKEEGLLQKSIKVALMGCAVNGPGEAREADIGIAGGIGEGLIFKHGKTVKKVKEEHLIDALIEEIKML